MAAADAASPTATCSQQASVVGRVVGVNPAVAGGRPNSYRMCRIFIENPSDCAPLKSMPPPLNTRVAPNYLHFHRIRVDLAHVLTPVLHLHTPDHKRPRIEVAVCHR